MTELVVTHDLQVYPAQWTEVASGRKSFEIVPDERDYQPGDLVQFREHDGDYTGRVTAPRMVTYVLRPPDPLGAVRQGFVIIALAAP
jgi:Domain of unknown function (DUF3850)